VNQPFANAMAIAQSLLYDTVHGPFSGMVSVRDNSLCVNGKDVYDDTKRNMLIIIVYKYVLLAVKSLQVSTSDCFMRKNQKILNGKTCRLTT